MHYFVQECLKVQIKIKKIFEFFEIKNIFFVIKHLNKIHYFMRMGGYFKTTLLRFFGRILES